MQQGVGGAVQRRGVAVEEIKRQHGRIVKEVW